LTRRWLIAASFAALGPVWVVFYATLLALPAPEGLTRFALPALPWVRTASFLFVIPWGISAFILLPKGLLGVFGARKDEVERRRTHVKLALIGAAAWGAVGLVRPLRHLRYAAANASAKHSEPVLRALRDYQRAVGTYPASLEILVPRYLPKVPFSGAFAYPDLEYVRDGVHPASGGFELFISMQNGMSADYLLYWPSERYPDTLPTGPVVSLGRWAFVLD
jgi:hypothetical protein